MGTSAARRAPQKGVFWRKAKAAAAHFAAEGTPSRFSVAEVVGRYVLALAPLDWSGMVPSGALPEVARLAAALGRFYETWETQGIQAALEYYGVPNQAGQSWATLLPALLETLAGPGASLAEAVARTALLDHFTAMGFLADLTAPVTAGLPPLPASDGVWHFLALALYRHAIADLGETLEFYAPTLAAGRQRLEAIKAHILAQLNLLIPLSGEGESWESQTETWLQSFLMLLGNYHVP